MQKWKSAAIGSGLIALAACGDVGSGRSFTYKITAEGAPTVENQRTYDTLGERTFTKTQKYRIAVQGDGEKPFHFLIVNVTKKLGSKIIADEKGVSLPISDGHYALECSHYYDQKLSKSVDEAEDPVCEIEIVGAIVPNARAGKIATSSAR